MANTFKFGTNGNWAVKDGYALAYNDENNNFKPLPFDFTRASSATRVNKQGLIETVPSGKPRIDFTNNTSGHLLLEPSRTNSLLQSNQFDTTWYNSNTSESVSSGGFGGLNYWTITKTAASGWIRQNLSLSGVQTLSVYAKSGTLNWTRIIATGSSTASTWFDLQNGVVGSADFGTESSNIESVGDGWYRCSITVDIGTVNGVRFYPADGNNDVSGTSGSILIQAAQLEVGSYATSYIPTEGLIETRVAESTSQTPPDGVIGQAEGTMFFEIDFENTSGVAGAWSISNGSGANRITMNTTNLSSTQFTLSIAQNYNSGSTKLASANVSFSDKHKVAIKYSGTTLKLFVDGQLSDSVSTDGFGNYTNFYVGGNQVGVGGDARKFIQVDLYNTALTDAELQNLTT